MFPLNVRRLISEYLGNLYEEQYLSALRNIITSGNKVGDRTGVGTRSTFGVNMRFDLTQGFPLLTTKDVFFRGVVEELLWILRGSTDNKDLLDKKVNIWSGNSSQANINKLKVEGDLKLDLKEHDCGAIYGFQLRHYGAKYIDCHTDYNGQGFDQLQYIINTLKTNPDDRRIVINMWNPCDFDKQTLPCCHVLYQFYVSYENKEKYLSCQMYQRSGDMFLGVPFNIASASLLTIMIAHITDMKPKELIHVIGNAHIYNNHLKQCEQQFLNSPRQFPTLTINRKVTDINDFKFSDFMLNGYYPHGKIKAEMAV